MNGYGPPRGGRGAVASDALLSLEGISKQYPGVRALDNVDFSVVAGHAHALVGENGAGKSTLIKIMSGLTRADTGRITMDGEPVDLRSPADAHRHGISLVPQELSVVAAMSIAENMFMGQLPRRSCLVRRDELCRRTKELMATVGLDVDPSSALGFHGPAVHQLVMIARGLAWGGRVFILDEPTAALADPEIERLFAVLDELKANGAALIYVSHRLREVTEIADDITVLRDGVVVRHLDPRTTNENELVHAMTGRPITRFFDAGRHKAARGEVRLGVRGLSSKAKFSGVSFDVHAGEILGIAGLMGSGRTEVVRAVFGVDRIDEGTIEVDGTPVRIRSPKDAIAAGIAYVPEERKAQGLVLNRSISDNLVMPHIRRLASGPMISERRLRAFSTKLSRSSGVKAPSVLSPVMSLSGGNQQKVVLGRWLTGRPKVYILDEPTRGVDVGAKADIYQQIGRLADEGAAVLVVSSELPEVLGICGRILVMRAGEVVGDVEASAASESSILELAMGAQINEA